MSYVHWGVLGILGIICVAVLKAGFQMRVVAVVAIIGILLFFRKMQKR